MDEYPTAHLKIVMGLEWVILQALWILMKQLNKRPKLERLTSHQDDDLTVDITTLPVDKQLNIDADKLATNRLLPTPQP